MHNSNDLDGLSLPSVADHIRIEIPKPIVPVEQLFMKVANPGHLAQVLKGFVHLGSETLCGVRTVFGEYRAVFV
jgi:hypothetical protein